MFKFIDITLIRKLCISTFEQGIYHYRSLSIKWDIDKTLIQIISTVFLLLFFPHWSMNYFVRSSSIHFKHLTGLYIAYFFTSGNYWSDYIILKVAIHNSPISDCMYRLYWILIIQWAKKTLQWCCNVDRLAHISINTELNTMP